jgi:hypothetical protein
MNISESAILDWPSAVRAHPGPRDLSLGSATGYFVPGLKAPG